MLRGLNWSIQLHPRSAQTLVPLPDANANISHIRQRSEASRYHHFSSVLG
jgi:hypothetical protein